MESLTDGAKADYIRQVQRYRCYLHCICNKELEQEKLNAKLASLGTLAASATFFQLLQGIIKVGSHFGWQGHFPFI